MKSCVAIAICVLTTIACAEPSINSYAAVTNDWYQGNFSNVYELAQARLAANSNDVVAAYLLHDWDMAFGYAADVSNGLNRVIAASDLVTNQVFSALFRRIRPAYLEYQREFLPTVRDSDIDAERYKAYRRGRIMTSSLMLRLLDEQGLW